MNKLPTPSSISARLILAALVATGLSIGGVASAHTESFPTSLSLSTSERTVPPGTLVTFSGTLDSPESACRASSQIDLMQTDDGFQVKTMTKKNGSYSVTRLIKESGTFQAVFGGKVLNGVHPHSHTCEASASNTVTVTVI
ncbi:MAG: hypothetical protein WD276_07235 [Actinomycetota bacterium]